MQSVRKSSSIPVIKIVIDRHCLKVGKDFSFLNLVSFLGVVLSYGGKYTESKRYAH